ncbi:hypothetical protein ACIPQ3_30245 [Streptomyces albidoflavus]
MTHAHTPGSVEDMAQSAAEAFFSSPAMMDTFRQLGEFTAHLQRDLVRASGRLITSGVLEALSESSERAHQSIRAQLSAAAARLPINTSSLEVETILSSPFEALPPHQREWAQRTVDEAVTQVEADVLVDEMHEEMFDEFVDTALTFAFAHPGLSRAAMKRLFVSYFVTLMFLALLLVQLESEAAKEFVETIGGAMLFVPPAAFCAARAFDKVKPAQGDEEGEGGDDHTA